MVDFDKLSRPKAKAKPIDPIEIFAKTPNLKDAPNDLWKGQADALSMWHTAREAEDNAIVLNTGAGKSLVGILIAQSLVNEQVGPVVYACSTIDLVSQTVRECNRLGLEHTTRVRQNFNNDRFETGRAFCITTYQALFSPFTAFGGQKEPAAVIFDDAHVAERLIRDAFTLSVKQSDYPTLYAKLVQIVTPEFERLNKVPHLNYVISDVGQQSITLCPPATAHRCREPIIEAFKEANYRSTELLFPVVQLYAHLGYCAILMSANGIEITPPFIPTGNFAFLGPGVRRVYLSATLEYETDFVRGFGRRVTNRIEPDNDAGNGERLILLGSDLSKEADMVSVANAVLKKQKLLISVPTYEKAKKWDFVASPPRSEHFSETLDRFRSQTRGAFILVSRIDGIDLPQDTCRVMLIDGAPSGVSLLDRYLLSTLKLSNVFSTKMASRITQLLGRINRGRSDYGAFLVYGRDINTWMKTERNIALLPPLIRKQVIMGQSLQDGMSTRDASEVVDVIEQVIARNPGWIKYYRDTIDGLEVSDEALQKVKERERQLAKSAVAECSFMTKLWQDDVEGARVELLNILDDTALADGKLAGWYSVWLGMTYEIENDFETGVAHYKKARSRLSSLLNVAFRGAIDGSVVEKREKTALQYQLLETNTHGPQALGDLVAKLRAQVHVLRDSGQSSNVHEEALRSFGELIGFSASRPDNELGTGPDVIWRDEETKEGVAFELKTKKDTPAEYNKKEVGQAHNHLQWLLDQYADHAFSGLIVIGPAGICRKEASPSDNLYLVELEVLTSRMSAFTAKIDDTRGKTVVERWAMLMEIGALPEWLIPGWFQALATTPIKSLQA